MKDIQVKLVSNQEIAPACFRMIISGPFEEFYLKPGQFIMLKLSKGYDPFLRRPFAANRFTTPEGIFLEIFYQVVGHGTRMMSHMLPDTELALLGPLGNGFTIPDKISTVFIVAGGMGIVPLRRLILHLVASNVKSIQVFQGTKSASQLLFLPELKKMEIPVHLSTEDGSVGHHGLVTELFYQFLDNHSSGNNDQRTCFACGPRSMLEEVAHLCFRYHLPCQVSLESRMACGIGVCLGCAVKLREQNNNQSPEKYGRVCLEGPVFDAQEVEW